MFNPFDPTMSMPTPILVHREDSRAWRVHAWTSFGLAVAVAGMGLAWLPGQDLDRAFMFMAYLFCTCAAFVVARHVRDREARRSETPGWGAVAWGGFAVAMGLTAWGLYRMEISPTYKAFLGVSWVFLLSTVFTLAKMLRDAHEALRERWRIDARRDDLPADEAP